MSDIVERLRGTADAFELAQAPHHLALYMRVAADEIERLRAGGCARDQTTTKYCAEAAQMAVEVERLRAALRPFANFCTAIDATEAGRLAPASQMIHAGLTVGAFRNARAALTKTEEMKG